MFKSEQDLPSPTTANPPKFPDRAQSDHQFNSFDAEKVRPFVIRSSFAATTAAPLKANPKLVPSYDISASESQLELLFQQIKVRNQICV